MEKLILAIVAYIVDNKKAVYSENQIIIGGKTFFMLLDEEGYDMTRKSFVKYHCLEGNETVLKEEDDFCIFFHNEIIGFLFTKLWEKYKKSDNKEEYIFFIDKRTKEIKRKV